ncbi:hypothetical protein JCM8097_006118 [Rhodosporidiobolus ruineniae]
MPAKRSRELSTSTTTSTSTSSTAQPLHYAASHPLVTVAHLAVRSAALLSLGGTAVVLALAAWGVLRQATRVPTTQGRERVWLHYGEWRPPYASVELPETKYAQAGRGQLYDLALELSVPVNQNNLQLGNFMISISLVDGTGDQVLNVSRPAILGDPSFAISSPTSSSALFPSIASYLNPLTYLSLPIRLLRSSPRLAHLAHLRTPTQTLLIPLAEGVSLAGATPSRGKRWGRSRAGEGVVRSVWVEVGRKDAHGPWAALGQRQNGRVAGGNGASYPRALPSSGGTGNGYSNGNGGANGSGHAGQVRELQVYESWLRIETKLKGLSALVHHHPYLLFALFFPTFLALELLAALLVYSAYVVRSGHPHAFSLSSEPATPTAASEVKHLAAGVEGADAEAVKREKRAPGEREGESDEEDVKPLLDALDLELELPSLSASASEEGSTTETSELSELTGTPPPVEFDEAEEEAARRMRARRMRLGKGGVGMSEVAGFVEGEVESEEEESETTETETETEGVGAELEEVEEAELEEAAEEGEKDEVGTIEGSETTAASRSSFGPSLAGTSASSTTTVSRGSTSAGAGGRGSLGGVKEETEESE